MIDIEQALAKSRREGVDTPENLPFLFLPEKRSAAGVLLVHGFTASPWEMRAIGETLAAAGFASFGVRLAGHGTSPEDLAMRRCEEWLASVEEGYDTLAAGVERVYGVGMSTGSLLLIALASARTLAGMVLLSPFLRLRHRLAPLTGLLHYVHPFQQVDLAPGLEPYYYNRRPLHGIMQLRRLIRRVRKKLGQVSAPALVISSEGDRTVDPASALELFHRLPGRQKEFHLLGPQAPHVLTSEENPWQREVFQLIENFLKTLESQKAPPAADISA